MNQNVVQFQKLLKMFFFFSGLSRDNIISCISKLSFSHNYMPGGLYKLKNSSNQVWSPLSTFSSLKVKLHRLHSIWESNSI